MPCYLLGTGKSLSFVSDPMSNLSIIERVEHRLATYAAGETTRAAFVDFLDESINALENVPMSVGHELWDHKHAIETEGYLEDEGFQANPGSVQEDLRTWLHGLKAKYCV